MHVRIDDPETEYQLHAIPTLNVVDESQTDDLDLDHQTDERVKLDMRNSLEHYDSLGDSTQPTEGAPGHSFDISSDSQCIDVAPERPELPILVTSPPPADHDHDQDQDWAAPGDPMEIDCQVSVHSTPSEGYNSIRRNSGGSSLKTDITEPKSMTPAPSATNTNTQSATGTVDSSLDALYLPTNSDFVLD